MKYKHVSGGTSVQAKDLRRLCISEVVDPKLLKLFPLDLRSVHTA